MKIVIRKEEKKDYFLVENLFREAFWNLYFPGCNEHFTAYLLRQHKDFIPELSLVLEVDDRIIGAILYSHSKVINKNNKEHKTITFGPVAIHPNYQGKGLGRKLIMKSIEMAKNSGYAAVIICGYPYHYKPYGFESAKKFKICMPDGKYYTGVQALALKDGTLDEISGTLYLSVVFEESENDALGLTLFDKQFPHKEKQEAPSQAEFAKAVCELDEIDY